jgi:hypothetical protein
MQRGLLTATYGLFFLRLIAAAALGLAWRQWQRIAHSAKITLSLLVLISLAAAQQNGAEAPKAPSRARRIFTNEDLNFGPSDGGLPPIPGLIKCGQSLRCFLQALDKASPAALTRTEIAKSGTAVVTSNSTWWTTQFVADRCTVSLRVDAIDAKVNEEVVPQATRHAVEDKLVEMKRDFETVRGKTGTCSLALKDLKALMTSSSWSLMSLGPASNFGKSCSGPAFDTSRALLEKDKK